VAWTFPQYWMLVTALPPPGVVRSGAISLLLTALSLDGLRTAITEFPIGMWAHNSLAITSGRQRAQRDDGPAGRLRTAFPGRFLVARSSSPPS
jgi:hypothetical protein